MKNWCDEANKDLLQVKGRRMKKGALPCYKIMA